MYMTKRESLPAWAYFIIAILSEVCADLLVRLMLVSACGDNLSLINRLYKLPGVTLCAFAVGFLFVLISGKTGPVLITSLFTHFTVTAVTVGFSVGLIFLNLLYILSALIGMLIAYIAVTHKG